MLGGRGHPSASGKMGPNPVSHCELRSGDAFGRREKGQPAFQGRETYGRHALSDRRLTTEKCLSSSTSPYLFTLQVTF